MLHSKKLMSILISATMLLSAFPVFASETDEPVVTVNGAEISDNDNDFDITITDPSSENIPVDSSSMRSTRITVHISMLQQPYTIDSFAKLELYSSDGQLLDYDSLWVGGVTTDLTYVFDVPEYTIGESFTLKLAEGLSSLQFYNDVYYEGQSIPLNTYTYENEYGDLIAANSFEMSAYPYFQKSVSLSYDGVPVSLSPGPRVVDGVTMVPIAQLAQYIGLDAEYNSAYNVEILSLGESDIYFNLGTAYTTVFGTDVNAPHPTVWIDGSVFASLRTFADALGCTLNVTDNYTSLNINMTSSPTVNNYYNGMFVNNHGISSRTDYLVWISLNEYKVRVYLGKQYQWKPIREMTCTIGAPESPTITGSFEYEYSMPRWDYGTYYVGPCLVFYGNYAIHSVFLYQDGSEYDGRVGMQLSHGCVRLKKNDIDWMYSMIPVGTRIYITP